MIPCFLKSTLLSAILLLAFFCRIQGIGTLPQDQFVSMDAYFYYHQAKRVSEHGSLPERDMQRWLPLGRDSGQTLNLYSYVLAYTQKAVGRVFPSVTLYHVALYMPPICFCIGLGALCVFLYHTYGLLFSSVVGVLLSTLPGALGRSVAGFSDRDAWCLMLGLLSILTYLVALQAQRPRHRVFWTLASGLIVFLGGISWEGFGVFISIILCVEIWKFLSSETEEGIGLYALWVCCFVPTLYLSSEAYRNGYGFAEHLFAFVLVPPVVFLGIRALRYQLLSKIEKLRSHARTLALSLVLANVVLAIGYVLIQHSTFSETTVPFSQNRFIMTINELNDPTPLSWMLRYGLIFVLGSLGVMITAMHNWKTSGIRLVFPLALFTLTTFFNQYVVSFCGAQISNILFFLAVVSTGMTFLFIAWRLNTHPKNEHIYVAATVWFLIWVALSREAIRYAFFTCVSLAFFTTQLLTLFLDIYMQTRESPTRDVLRKAILTTVCLAGLILVPQTGGYAHRLLNDAKERHIGRPGKTPVAAAYQWMKTELPATSIVAAGWTHGNHLNVLGGVKTITDADHYIQNWIFLYYQYVFCASSEQDALEFLKSHGATHLMLTQTDIDHSDKAYSLIRNTSEKQDSFEIIPLMKVQQTSFFSLIPIKKTPLLNFIQVAFERGTPTPTAVRARQGGEILNLPYVAFHGKHLHHSTAGAQRETGGVLLYFDEHQKYQKGYYIPPRAWNSLAIRLYFRGELPEGFRPVYPTARDATATAKVWEIHYPPDIKTDVKYLKTGIREIDKDLRLQ